TFVLLDVRSREEYANGHLRGAWNFPYEELEYADGRRSCITGLPRGAPIIVYCDYGSHSMQAARILERLGYQVINTAGGLSYYRGRHMVRGT
ncbi:MAG: rhodanese-like domain-containing protein, partial [Lachnospiraceae bacterium]|nr:rhodanese-like domain-containing protein [Lachnospiraceae bacterium]